MWLQYYSSSHLIQETINEIGVTIQQYEANENNKQHLFAHKYNQAYTDTEREVNYFVLLIRI